MAYLDYLDYLGHLDVMGGMAFLVRKVVLGYEDLQECHQLTHQMEWRESLVTQVIRVRGVYQELRVHLEYQAHHQILAHLYISDGDVPHVQQTHLSYTKVSRGNIVSIFQSRIGNHWSIKQERVLKVIINIKSAASELTVGVCVMWIFGHEILCIHIRMLMLFHSIIFISFLFYFFFNDTATTEIYTLSLHDALPILLPFSRCSSAPASFIDRFSLRQRPRIL